MENRLQLMLITNDPATALAAEAAGVDRIFLDLERLGKQERQGHLDTYISDHEFEDLIPLRESITRSQILVRVNPVNVKTQHEVDKVIRVGADIVMLPMFVSRKEVEQFVEAVDGRARVCLLLETPQALVRLEEIATVPGVHEIHIGMNDLHIAFRLKFMFELLSGGLIEYAAAKIKSCGVTFGFGGIARVGEGLLPAEKIIGEHARLGSELAILSRTFHRGMQAHAEQASAGTLALEIEKIRAAHRQALLRTASEVEHNRLEVQKIVWQITEKF